MKLRIARMFYAGLIPVLVLAIHSFVSALDVPPLRGRVNDLAGMLPADRAQALEERLAAFEGETGHQIAVLTIPSLQGDALENFSIRVAEAWKIGQKGFDNGAILLIARDDRKLRIEVGYGLEGVLPDAIASRIIREVILPRFRENNYAGGIEDGVNAIMQVTKGEPIPQSARQGTNRSVAQGSSLLTALTMTAILALFIGMLQRRLLGGAFSGAVAGLLSALVSAAGPALALAIIVGAIVGAIGSTLSVASSSNQWTGSSRYRRGGWGGGWYGGGGFGGGGFGGGSGGFSGGGGGFGGGGASGSW
ncbi:MAG TPA: TPM domain-containing protein [Candidatus Acidoferrales bacterium]|nr:TPM domain-containing protein [Candidatus Acidoferrales bacterium]